MRRLLASLLFLTLFLSLVACTADYEEIAVQGQSLDRGENISGYDCAYGLNALNDRITSIFEDNDDVVNYGKDIVEAKVTFDDANILVGDEYSLPTRIFYYTMSDVKTSIISNALNIDATGDDAKLYWDTNYPDQNYTIIEKAYQNALMYCQQYLATFYAMEDYGFEETEDYLYTYENILAAFGTVEAMDEYFSAYGLTGDYLKMLHRYQTAYMQFKGYLINPDGILYPSDEEAYEYFENDCVYMQQIVFSYVEVDEINRWVSKSPEDIEASRAKGEEVYAKILEDPDMFIRNLDQSQFSDWRDNVKGYYYSPYEIQETLLNAYYELEVGEITAIDTPIGYYIIKAAEKTPSVFEVVKDRVVQALCDEIHKEVLAPYFDRFTLDEEQYNRYEFDDIITFQ